VTEPEPAGWVDQPAADAEPAAGAEPGGTGHPSVDAALAQLDAVAELAPAEQVAAYEAAHRALTGTLSAIDQS